MKHATTTTPPKTELCKLFYKYKSDKCPQIYHSYSEHYYDILKNYKESIKSVIEIGIGTEEMMKGIGGDDYEVGASLRAWRDFFPNATIFGLDYDEASFFKDERIHCYFTDQSNPKELKETISNIRNDHGKKRMFDLIIDDGSHKHADQWLTFDSLFPHLAVGGLYIIEDIKRKNLPLWYKRVSQAYMVMAYPGIKKLGGDAFVCFQKH